MKKFKKVMAVVAALALTAGMTVNCMAKDTWGSYFGREQGKGHGIWFEGAEGTLQSQSADSWTAKIKEIGWGGIWGGQVYQNTKDGFGSVNVVKGKEYTLKATLKSSNCDKWVFIKIATKEDIAFGKWVRLKKGSSVTLNETFTAKCNANSIYFGIGGEFGDRDQVDEKAIYTYAEGGQDAIVKETDQDALLATVISCTGYSLAEKTATQTNEATTAASGATTTTTTTVTTGDFEPYAFGFMAIAAAAAVVVFSKKREQA